MKYSEQKNSINYKNTNHKSSKQKIVVNVSQTQYKVVKEVVKSLDWQLCTQPISKMKFDICWTDKHVRYEILSRMSANQKINHFGGMEILSRKNNLGRLLMKFRKAFGEQYAFFPLTWSLPTQFPDLKQYHQQRKEGKAQTFIVKPEACCQGRGIFLTRNIEKLRFDKCVVQRYLHKPYLIDQLKFDLRIYVLLAGIDPFRIYVYEEGLARFATETYQSPKADNLDNKFIHLTNYAINKNNPNFIFNDDIQKSDIGHKRSLTSLFKRLQANGTDIQQLKKSIDDIIIKTLIVGHPTLSRVLQQTHPNNFRNDICFEILGFDIMLDHKLNPYLLQINYTPSFAIDTPLDAHIKKNLISDTIQLLNMSTEFKNQRKASSKIQTIETLVTGKRKNYQIKQRFNQIQQATKVRDQYEATHMGNFRKIFLIQKNNSQYKKYYEFSEQIYKQQHEQNFKESLYHPFYKYYLQDNYCQSTNNSPAPDKDKYNRTATKFTNNYIKNVNVYIPKVVRNSNSVITNKSKQSSIHETDRFNSSKCDNNFNFQVKQQEGNPFKNDAIKNKFSKHKSQRSLYKNFFKG